jgi:Tfp pilus assembly protein PilP
MKLTTGILMLGMAAATAWGQNPDVIQDTRDTMHALQQKQRIDSNAALAASEGRTAQSAAVPHSSSAPAAHARTAAASQNPAPTTKATASAAKSKAKVVAVSKPRQRKQSVAVQAESPAAPSKEQKPRAINMSDRRDPFVSPVVNRSMTGSGCSTGKRCLAIDQIALKGVVKSDAGMIAVVVNALDKAYFLRENDPVFNGYVVRITGDSIIFKETIQDKLGKPFTREVTKKITTPAV